MRLHEQNIGTANKNPEFKAVTNSGISFNTFLKGEHQINCYKYTFLYSASKIINSLTLTKKAEIHPNMLKLALHK